MALHEGNTTFSISIRRMVAFGSGFYSSFTRPTSFDILEKRLELNKVLMCRLKIGKVVKTTYSIEFNNQAYQSFILQAEGEITKQ